MQRIKIVMRIKIVIRIERLEDFIQNRFGYCFYELGKNTALIYGLYVHPEYRLQGKAKILLQHVINEIREADYTGEIVIEAIPREDTISLEKVESFYERMGLKVLNSRITSR